MSTSKSHRLAGLLACDVRLRRSTPPARPPPRVAPWHLAQRRVLSRIDHQRRLRRLLIEAVDAAGACPERPVNPL